MDAAAVLVADADPEQEWSRFRGFAAHHRRFLREAGIHGALHGVQPLGPLHVSNPSFAVSGAGDPCRAVSALESSHMGGTTAGGTNPRRTVISPEHPLLPAAPAQRIFADRFPELVLHSHSFSSGARRVLSRARPGAKPRGFDPGRLRVLIWRLH